MEIWKHVPVEWYSDVYMVSNEWKIKRLIDKYGRGWDFIVKTFPQSWGYPVIHLRKNRLRKACTVHRIVAIAFIDNPLGYRVVNHKNWIKTDNRVENLEWCTQSDNMQHAYNSWLNRNVDTLSRKNRIRIIQYSLKWEKIKEWDSIIEAWKNLWIDSSGICKWLKFWNAVKGFLWRKCEPS